MQRISVALADWQGRPPHTAGCAGARDGAVAGGRDRHALVAQVLQADVVLHVSPGGADARVGHEDRAALGSTCDADRPRRARRRAAHRVRAPLAAASVPRSSAAGLSADGAASVPAVTARSASGPAAPSGLAATPPSSRACLSTVARRPARVTADTADPGRRAARADAPARRAAPGAARQGATRSAGPARWSRVGSAGHPAQPTRPRRPPKQELNACATRVAMRVPDDAPTGWVPARAGATEF